MRRMLDPTKVGGIPSTIEFDKDGNRKVTKNLGVDGEIYLRHLKNQSENTKGMLRLRMYNIWTTSDSNWINIFAYAPNSETTGQNYGYTIASNFFKLKTGQSAHVMAGGYVNVDGEKYPISWLSFNYDGSANVMYFDYASKTQKQIHLDSTTSWNYSSVGDRLL